MIALPRCLAGFIFALVLAGSAHAFSLADPQTVVASQGGARLTLADIDGYAEGIPAEDRARFFASPQRVERLLTNLLVQKQLAAAARNAGLDKDPALQESSRLSLEQRLAFAESKRFRDTLQVPDMEQLAKETWLANPEAYARPATLVVEQILVSSAERDEGDARELANKIANEARQDPSKFTELIEQYSDDPDKSRNHGRVENAAAHSDATFTSVVRMLQKPGDVSPAVKTDDGFVVLKLIERGPAETKTFADVRAQIVEQLRRDYIKRKVREHTDILRNQPIDANPDALALLRTRYQEPAPAPEPAKAKTKAKAKAKAKAKR